MGLSVRRSFAKYYEKHRMDETIIVFDKNVRNLAGYCDDFMQAGLCALVSKN